MSRKPNIKWRESDTKKLDKQVKSFNDKVYRTRKKHPEIALAQPKIITAKEKKKMIEELKASPRSEFNKVIKSLARYNKKGAEQMVVSKKGITTTKWEKKEVGIKMSVINATRAKELKNVEALEATSRGVPLGTTRGEMGSERLNSLKPKKYNFDEIEPGVSWEKFKVTVTKQSSAKSRQEKIDLYKQNYLQALDAYGGYADDIKWIVEQLPSDRVVETYYTEQEADIPFVYSGVDGRHEKDMTLDILRELWQSRLDAYEDEISS